MKKIIVLTIVFMNFLVNFSEATETYGDIHFVNYIKMISGNTFLADIPGVSPLLGKKIEVVLKGITVPKIKAGCQKERNTAKTGMALAHFLLKRSKDITLHNIERGRRFRLVATVLADGKDIRQILIAKGVAVNNVSHKNNKDWCQ